VRIEQSRLERWQRASRVFKKEVMWLTIVGGQLGRLDADLIAKEALLLRRAKPMPGGGRQVQYGNELFLSYLWVLGGYEFVRVLSQRQKEGPPFFQDHLPNVRPLKRLYERVRMPLAKLEPAKKYRKTDYAIAFPHFDLKKGRIGWSVASDVVITRRELSDKLLEFLEAIRPK